MENQTLYLVIEIIVLSLYVVMSICVLLGAETIHGAVIALICTSAIGLLLIFNIALIAYVIWEIVKGILIISVVLFVFWLMFSS